MNETERLDFGGEPRNADKLITGFVKSGNALDIGCNDGRRTIAYLSANGFKAIGIDKDCNSITEANTLYKSKKFNAKFICSDILDYTPNKKFDVITMHFVLQHIREDEKEMVLNKMVKFTKTNGINAITFFNEMDPNKGKKRIFDGFEKDIKKFYIKKGWTVKYYKKRMKGHLAIGGSSIYSIIIVQNLNS